MSDDSRGKNEDGKLLYCSFCGKSQHEVRKLIANLVLDLKRRLNDIMSKHTNQDLKTIERDLERDNFMSAEVAVEYGLIDTVLEKRLQIGSDSDD